MQMKASYPEQQPNVESLIVDNMNLVKKIAWHMHGRVRASIEIEDLMQIGYFGLVTAAQNTVLKREQLLQAMLCLGFVVQ